MDQFRLMLVAMAIFRIADAMAGVSTDRNAIVTAIRKEISRLIMLGRLPRSVSEISDAFIRGVLDQHPAFVGAEEFSPSVFSGSSPEPAKTSRKRSPKN